MAKSKKQEAAQEQPAEAAKTKTAKKSAGNKAEGATSAGSAGKAVSRKGPSSGSASPSVPMVDTSLAAAAAARMVANRDQRSGGESRGGSGLIKHLKDTLNKTATTGPADFLHNTSQARKSNLPFGGRKQVGHNQTFGADVNRTGVPRRTGG
jgi:hypothetical protein